MSNRQNMPPQPFPYGKPSQAVPAYGTPRPYHPYPQYVNPNPEYHLYQQMYLGQNFQRQPQSLVVLPSSTFQMPFQQPPTQISQPNEIYQPPSQPTTIPTRKKVIIPIINPTTKKEIIISTPIPTQGLTFASPPQAPKPVLPLPPKEPSPVLVEQAVVEEETHDRDFAIRAQFASKVAATLHMPTESSQRSQEVAEVEVKGSGDAALVDTVINDATKVVEVVVEDKFPNFQQNRHQHIQQDLQQHGQQYIQLDGQQGLHQHIQQDVQQQHIQQDGQQQHIQHDGQQQQIQQNKQQQDKKSQHMQNANQHHIQQQDKPQHIQQDKPQHIQQVNTQHIQQVNAQHVQQPPTVVDSKQTTKPNLEETLSQQNEQSGKTHHTITSTQSQQVTLQQQQFNHKAPHHKQEMPTENVARSVPTYVEKAKLTEKSTQDKTSQNVLKACQNVEKPSKHVDKHQRHNAEKHHKPKQHQMQQQPPSQQHQPTPSQQQQQTTPQSQQFEKSPEGQGSEWQETKKRNKKKIHQQPQHTQQQQQQPHRQLKPSSSNGVKSDLSKQSSNPLTTNQSTSTNSTTSANSTSVPASTNQPPAKAPCVVWPSIPTHAYKRKTSSTNSPSEISQQENKTPEVSKEIKPSENKVVDSKVSESKVTEETKGSDTRVTDSKGRDSKKLDTKHIEKKVIVEVVKKKTDYVEGRKDIEVESSKKVEEVKIFEATKVAETIKPKVEKFVKTDKIDKVEGKKRIEEAVMPEKKEIEEKKKEVPKKKAVDAHSIPTQKPNTKHAEKVIKKNIEKAPIMSTTDKVTSKVPEKSTDEVSEKSAKTVLTEEKSKGEIKEEVKKAHETTKVLEQDMIVPKHQPNTELKIITKVDKPVKKVDTPINKVNTPAVKVETPAVKVETPAVKVETPVEQIEEKIEEKANSIVSKTTEVKELEEGEIEDDEETVAGFKCTYEPDQWSPSNPTGKKVYDRTFLLHLQFCPTITRPQLPPLEIILSQPITSNMNQGSYGGDFNSYVRSSSASQNRGYINKNKTPGNQGNMTRRQFSNEQVGGRRVINLNLQTNVTLHQSENSWAKNKTHEETDETKVMAKKFRSILNKLTPQRFDVLSKQADELSISTEEQLTSCIDILFEKAINEPSFAVTYARMAKHLFSLSVPANNSTDPSQKVTFKKVLLTKCQHEFEKDKQEEEEIALLQGQIDATVDEAEKKKLTLEMQTAMWKGKKRSLGNTKFIGEFFKNKMLTEKIMHECLRKLLVQEDDEDSLECLCQLFTTIGKDIDKGDKLINSYFLRLKQIVDKKKISARIRFMISDVEDLRKGNWKPRHDNNNPKMIDQIHKEAKLEEMERQQKTAEMGQRRKYDEHHRPSYPKVPTMQDGWSNVAKPPKTNVDFKLIKLTKSGVDEHTKLGPPRRTWGKGSMGGASVPAKQPENKRIGTNRFALLSSSMEAAERQDTTNNTIINATLAPSREQYRNRITDAPLLPNKHQLLSASQEKPSKDLPKPSPLASQSATLGRKTDKKMSEEEIIKKTRVIVEEFFYLNDLKEALECIEQEMYVKECWSNAVTFLFQSFVNNIERSSKVREQIGVLHRSILMKKMIPAPTCYSIAVRKLVVYAEEAFIDIPQIWEYIGEVVCPIFLQNSSIPLSILLFSPNDKSYFPDEVEQTQPGSEAKLFANVLNSIKHHLGHFTAKEMWESSYLKWSNMVSENNLKDFIKKHGLEYTEESKQDGGRGRRHRLVSVNEDKNKLIELYATNGSTVEQVQDWIHENMHIQSSSTSTPSDLKHTLDILAALTMASLIKRGESEDAHIGLDEDRFKRFLGVVRTYSGSRQDRQLHLLFGLQDVVHRLDHPSNLLYRLFELLLDADVVNETAFHQWHDDTTRPAGKGIALQSVKRFFDWIKEEEKDSSKE